MYATELEVRSLHQLSSSTVHTSRVAAERSSLRQALAERRAEQRRQAESRYRTRRAPLTHPA